MIGVGQQDLFAWEPPQPAVEFDERAVQAATMAGRVSRAISVTLAECGQERPAIAEAMGEYLGRPISRHMLDAYASQAREDHSISLARFDALVHVTRDARLLGLLAGPRGWAVVERRFLPLIELAAVRERQAELQRRGEALRRKARSGGLI